MKIERRITFIVGREGFAAWKVNRLKTLSGYFRSVVILNNITQRRAANTEKQLKVISLGSKYNDLCQLWIEGSDAELAFMVLTDFIAGEFVIVKTLQHSRAKPIPDLTKSHPSFALSFDIDYQYDALSKESPCTKNHLLCMLSSVESELESQSVHQMLLAREQVSSTYIGHGIALPHAIHHSIKTPKLQVIRLATDTDWHSPRGNVRMMIGLLLPKPPDKAMVMAFTQLSRALLDDEFCRLLNSTIEQEALKAILFHTMSHPFSASQP
jgi:PTS system nitrogen regulatory IIA component